MARVWSNGGLLLAASVPAGLAGVTLWSDDAAPVASLAAAVARPTEGGLILLALVLRTLWRDRGGAALAGAGAALLCIVLAYLSGDLATGTPAQAPTSAAPGVLAGLLAASVMLYHAPVRNETRFKVLALAALVSVAVPLAILVVVAMAEDASAVDARAAWRLMAVAMLGLAYSMFLAVAAVAPASSALRWLGAPIGAAGLAGTGAFAWLLGAAGAPAGPSSTLVALLAASAAGLTAALIGGARLGSVAIDLHDSAQRAKRRLRRQRRLMHAREQTLRESQRRYAELFRAVPAAVLLAQPAGGIIAANPAMLELLGLESEDELDGLTFRDFYADPGERDRLIEIWHASHQDLWKGEVKLKRRDGEEINVLYAARIVRDETGAVDHHQGMFTDITALRRSETERRALEMHLRLSQKLESVGRLAAGIAHEINTPMQYVGDNIHFLKHAFEALHDLLSGERQILDRHLTGDGTQLLHEIRRLEDQADLAFVLEAVPRALSRTADGVHAVNSIVGAMKELAHPAPGLKVRADINALLNTALVVTRNEYNTTAAVETSFGDVPPLLVQKNELCQVFINLIVNAAHAIANAQRQDKRAGLIRIETTAGGSDIAVRVADNGCGIPEVVLEKIFDPFFTTKEVGKGTGQGLAIARNTVHKHGGRIEVDSTPSVGTVFTIKLPLEQAETNGEA